MKLRKIRLINWHQFWDSTIEIENNTLLTGDNGSGKSTLLDAIFFVLSGGENKRFNKAANEESIRTLESYMRGKLGVEGKEYLRDVKDYPDIISHIALEFVSENSKNSTIIGCVLELNGVGNAKPKFYIIDNIPLTDLKLEVDKQISDSDKLKEFYGNIFIEMNKSKRLNRSNIAKILGLNRNAGEKYYNLLIKAIAFKPVQGDVSQFVNDFLLKENNVNIDSLQNELRSYKEISENISRENDKKQLLESFIGKAERYHDNIVKIECLEILKDDHEINRIELENERLNKSVDKKRLQINSLVEKINQNNKKRENNEALLKDLYNKDSLKAYNRAKEILTKLEEGVKECSTNITRIKNNLFNDIETIRALGFKFDFRRDIREGNFVALNTHINDYIVKKKQLDNELRNEIASENSKLRDCTINLSKEQNSLSRLEKNLNNYRQELLDLIDEVKQFISNKYKKNKEDIFVKPICECIEIKEPDWTNAIEGYLNTQRFDLIVEKEYYLDAIKVTNSHKDLTYGIVDVKNADGEVKEGSLYQKIRVVDDLADGILRCILGKVICVEDLDELNQHSISISKSCMIYKNYTARNLHRKAYEIPFIGKDSQKKRIEIIKDKIENLNNLIGESQKKITDNDNKIKLIEDSSIKEIISQDFWSKRDELLGEVENQQKLIKSLSNDSNMLGVLDEIKNLEEEIKNIKSKVEQQEKEKDDINISIGTDTNKIEENSFRLNSLRVKRSEKFDGLSNKSQFEIVLKKYSESGKVVIDLVEKEWESCNNYNNSTRQTILKGMSDYANLYSKNLFADISNIVDYVAEYNRLKEDDIPSLQVKAKKILEETRINFNDNFISVLREKINEGIEEIKSINKNLRNHPFGNLQEVYEFTWKESGDQEMRDYYRIITSGKDVTQRDLFTQTLNQKDLDTINRLFDKLSGSGAEQERNLMKYLDYRNYLSYDIVIKYGNGDKAYFSKIYKEKSGGETQTPFYVIIGSCFNELINKNQEGGNSCFVIFDEAFNNMDESRIQTLMEFYKKLSLQVMIVVPSNRCHTLMQYVDCTIGLIQYNYCIDYTKLENKF